MAGPSWNDLLAELRKLSVGPETFAGHLKTHLPVHGWFFLIRHTLLSLYYVGCATSARIIIINFLASFLSVTFLASCS